MFTFLERLLLWHDQRFSDGLAFVGMMQNFLLGRLGGDGGASYLVASHKTKQLVTSHAGILDWSSVGVRPAKVPRHQAEGRPRGGSR